MQIIQPSRTARMGGHAYCGRAATPSPSGIGANAEQGASKGMDLVQTSSRQAEPPTVPVDELEHDPHGVFRHYRRLVPFIKRSDGAALVLRNKDVQQFLSDSRTRQAETEFAELRGIEDGVLFDFFKYSMLTSNGSDHRRRRAGFSMAFAFRVMAALQPHIRKVADDLIDEWYVEGEIDFLDRYASQIPARIIGHILGMPPEDIPFFTRLVYTTTRVLSVGPAEDLPEIEHAASQLFDYVERLAAARRAAPGDDFLSLYLAAADQAAEMSPLEIRFRSCWLSAPAAIPPAALSPCRPGCCCGIATSGTRCVAIPPSFRRRWRRPCGSSRA